MYRNILVPIDLNATGFSDKAITSAIWQAQQSKASLYSSRSAPLVTLLPVKAYLGAPASSPAACNQKALRCELWAASGPMRVPFLISFAAPCLPMPLNL